MSYAIILDGFGKGIDFCIIYLIMHLHKSSWGWMLLTKTMPSAKIQRVQEFSGKVMFSASRSRSRSAALSSSRSVIITQNKSLSQLRYQNSHENDSSSGENEDKFAIPALPPPIASFKSAKINSINKNPVIPANNDRAKTRKKGLSINQMTRINDDSVI